MQARRHYSVRSEAVSSRQRSSHPFAVTIVLALAAVVGAFAIAAIWANQQLLDTRSWVAVSGRMLDSPEVRQRVAAFLSEELIDEAEGRLSAAGEDEVAAEVMPQLRRRGPGLAEQVIASPPFRVVWLRANSTAHRALLRVLYEDGGSDGAVVVNLTPALRELADSLSDTELAESLEVGDLGSLIEPGSARIEVLEADELDQAQDAVRAIRSLPVPATIATLALLALALLLGRAAPARTFFAAGLSLAAAGGLALLARALAGQEVIDALLAADADREAADADREAAEAAWRISTSTAVELAVGAICLGGLIALFAALAGNSAPAVGLRRGLAPLLRTPLAALFTLAIAVIVFLLLLAWAPIAALEAPLGALLFAAVFAAGALALGRQTIGEEKAP
jgi:hypothetical protein